MRFLAILLLFALAGCTDPLPAGDIEAGPGALASAAYDFVCNAQTREVAEGVCAQRLDAPGTQLSEPALAIHPNQPDTMAVGVHMAGAASAAQARIMVPGVFVTDDAGATWTLRQPPVPDLPPAGFSDPALVFLDDGTLVFTGMSLPLFGAFPSIYATTSSDGGATWSEPQKLSEGGGVDRQWVTVGSDGTVFVSWQVYPTTSHVSWSTDGGASWTSLDETPEDCRNASPVAWIDGRAHVACTRVADGDYNVEVFAIDTGAGRLEHVSQIPNAGYAARLLPTPAGVIATTYNGFMAQSNDHGVTWAPVVNLHEALSIDDDWPGMQVYWSNIDGQGQLQLLVAPFHRSNEGIESSDYPAALVRIDAKTLDVLEERRITPAGAEWEAAPPNSAMPVLGDDWWGLEFAGDDRGALVWMYAGGIEVGLLAVK